jgi:hypothetical protein
MRPETKPAVVLLLLSGMVPLQFAVDEGFPSFSDVAGELGITLENITGSTTKDYIVEVNGNGAGFFDYDNDGDQDVLIANGSTLGTYQAGGDPMAALYRNEGGRFVNVTLEANLESRGWGMGVCIADYDNDGHRDFYLTAYGANVLYRNNGDGTFSETTALAGVGNEGWSTNCAFGDYDRDGDVDLYVANYLSFDESEIPRRGETDVCRYLGAEVFCGPRGLASESDVLYRNEADGTFRDVTSEAGIAGPTYSGFGVVFSDFDDDGWPDIYVANDMMPNLLYHNNRDGRFSETGLVSGVALNDEGREQAGMGVGVGDYDGNGFLDIFVTHFSRDTNTLYQNIGGMMFADATSSAGLGGVSLPHLGWGAGFADLDNDGWEDLFVANGHVYPEIDALDTGDRYLQRKEVYRNTGEGRFEEIASELEGSLLAPKSARGTAFGDYDNDGDIDVLAININDRPSLYRNEGGNGNHWVGFRLEGTRSNRDAIGARVEIVVGTRSRIAEVRSGGSYLSHNDMRIHFGLGEAAEIDGLRIRWPSGEVEEMGALEGDRFWTVREGEGVVRPR